MELILKGMIKGMEQLGAEYKKLEGGSIFFTVPRGSEIDNQKKLVIARDAFAKQGYTLKIKKQ